MNAATGALVWEYSTEGTIYSAPTVAGGILYVASTDGNIYAFTAAPYPDNPTAYAVPTVGANPPQFTPFRTPVPAPPLDGDKQCFDETGKCVRGAFLAFWNANGALDRFGPAVTDELNEGGRTVQYFRNAYLQMYTQPDGTPGVRPGPLDYHLFYYTPEDVHFDKADPISGTTYVPETGHNLPRALPHFLAHPRRRRLARLPRQRVPHRVQPGRQTNPPCPVLRARPPRDRHRPRRLRARRNRRPGPPTLPPTLRQAALKSICRLQPCLP